MNLESSPIYPEIARIINKPVVKFGLEYGAIIHTPVDDIRALDIVSIDVQQDYNKGIGAYTYLRMLVGMGTYTKYIHPYLHNLEVSINTTDGGKVYSKRYKFVIINQGSPNPDLSGISNMGPMYLDTQHTSVISGQLVDRQIEILRLKSTGGIFSNTDVGSVLQTLYKTETDSLVVDGDPVIDVVDMVPVDNRATYRQIVIPDNTKVISLPDYLQTSVGVYNAGIGSYVQTYQGKDTLFIYPLYNWKVKAKAPGLIIYALDESRFSIMDNSFRVEGGVVHMIGSTERQVVNTGEQEFMSEGSGVRITDTASIMSKPVEMTPQGPVAARGRLNYEVGAKNRDDSNNYANMDNQINLFEAYTQVNRRNGHIFTIQWTYSRPDLLYPGMGVKVVSLRDNQVVHVYGILLGTHTLYTKPYIPTTSLNIFLESFVSP